MLKSCGETVAEAIHVVEQLFSLELEANPCTRIGSSEALLPYLDHQNALHNLALAIAGGDAALTAMTARRLLEESSSMLAGSKRYYNTIPAEIAKTLEERGIDSQEELDKLKTR